MTALKNSAVLLQTTAFPTTRPAGSGFFGPVLMALAVASCSSFAIAQAIAPAPASVTLPSPSATPAPVQKPPAAALLTPLSSPLGNPVMPSGNAAKGNPSPALSPPATPAAASAALGLPAGQGAGVHGAGSPFPQLTERSDVVPWSVLTSAKTKVDKNRVLPVFNAGQLALHQKTQRIQGFMVPLEPGIKQSHFLLSSVPLTCAFCTPGGPESMVEVKTKIPVKYAMDIVVVEGNFQVLNDDAFGLFYRVTDAVPVK